jgi:transcriptional regulator with XRE-family HTH domain
MLVIQIRLGRVSRETKFALSGFVDVLNMHKGGVSMVRQQYTDDSLVSRVGMRIRKLRKEQGVSLRDFGKRAGLHPFHVMTIELGQLAANTRTLRAIAKALGVEPLDLLNHDPDRDDLGFIIELMRKQPEVVQRIKLKVRPLVEN